MMVMVMGGITVGRAFMVVMMMVMKIMVMMLLMMMVMKPRDTMWC